MNFKTTAIMAVFVYEGSLSDVPEDGESVVMLIAAVVVAMVVVGLVTRRD